ncbi:hypothetical protein HKD37_U057928 [Glycine soja]
MTTLTQIWMALLLSKILPSDHNSDLPLLKWIAPTRHPVDPEKSNRALGFPTLIAGLCQFYEVLVAPSKVIRPPINKAFIEKYCTPRLAQGEAPQQPGDGQQQATDALPPLLESTSAHLQRLERGL